MNLEDFDYEFARQGYVKFENVQPDSVLEVWRNAVDDAVNLQRKTHNKGEFAHLLHTASPCFMRILNDPPLWPYITRILGEETILHSFGAVRLVPSVANPIQNAVHRDTPRFVRPYLLSCQTLIMVDDFTESNGATWVLPGSHHLPDRPTEAQFRRGAVQITGSAGDAVLFDSLLWHRGGANETQMPRRGITMVFSRSFVKPQFEMTHTISEREYETLSDVGRQLLGFRSRPPRTIEEFSLPRESRSYVADD